MSSFIKSLCYIKEFSAAIHLIFKWHVYHVCNAVTLIDKWVFRNSIWCYDMSWFSSINSFKRLKSNYSKNFHILGRHDVGLYEVICSGGLPGSMITWALFKLTYSVHRMTFYVCVRWIVVFLGNSKYFQADYIIIRCVFFVYIQINICSNFN